MAAKVGVGVGDRVTFRYRSGKESSWQVVGLLFDSAQDNVGLLSIMALTIAGIGGVGLSGMLSLSVLERTREIGVMRAIGAASSTITRLFIGEGLIQALLSRLIALPMGIALAHLLSTRVISTILDDQLIYQFTLRGPLLWLVLVIVLVVLASWAPARKATRIGVSESLVYQ